MKKPSSIEEELIIYFDIESEGADDFEEKQIYCIGVKCRGKHHIFSDDNEKVVLNGFIKTLDFYSTKHHIILIGHNIYKYDIPHIMARCDYHKIKHPFRNVYMGSEKLMTNIQKGTDDMSWFNAPRLKAEGIDIVDTMHLLIYWDVVKSSLSGYGLKNAAITLGFRNSHRLELSFQEILECWDTNREKLHEYLIYDLDDTEFLGEELMPPYWYMCTVIPMTLTNLCISTTAKRAEVALETYYKMDYNTKPTPDFITDFMGGSAGVQHIGLYKKPAKIDVSSMYPSIMLLYKINTRKDPDNYLLKLLKYLLVKRLENKKLKGDKKADAINQAYKVLINSFYGLLGSRQPFNDLKAAATVTTYGRKLIDLMLATIRDAGGKVIEWDTDGIIYVSDNNREIFDKVQNALPKGIDVEYEFENVEWIYVPKIKNYIIKYENGKYEKKGLYKKRNRFPLESQITIDLCEEYLKATGKNPYLEYVDKIVNNTIDRTLLTVTGRKIGKKEKTIIQNMGGKAGDKVSYVMTYGMHGDAIHSKPNVDKKLHKTFYVGELDNYYHEFCNTLGIKPETYKEDLEEWEF